MQRTAPASASVSRDQMPDRSLVEELIYRSCLLLDEKNYSSYLDLCDERFRYTITTYSPEIRRDMVWLEHDKNGMTTLLNQLPRHNSDHSPITRHATVYTMSYDAAARQIDVVSALQVFKTALDGGVTELFAVGKYLDAVKVDEEKPRLLKRVVKLDTRMLGIGYHVPF